MVNRIGINLLYINPKLSGGSVTYAVKLLKEIAEIDGQNQYIVYVNKDCSDFNFNIGSNFTVRVLNFSYKSVYLRYFWEQFILPFYVIKDKVDLLHSLGYVGPILCPVKKITSILDINYKGHGANMGKMKKVLLGTMVYLTAKTSKHIITISQFSKEQIVKYISCPPDKITVTLLSGMNDNKPFINLDLDLSLLYGIKNRYIIAFSGTSPHKNILNLIKAFAIVVQSIPDIQLALVGHKVKGKEIDEIISNLNLEDKIIFTGFVPDDHISTLIKNAHLFVFPSLYEGFGIPILDAQAEGVPVASSNAGSLPEVGGNAPLYFDPQNIMEMSDSIVTILLDKKKSDEVVLKGLQNRMNFSWAETAQETLDVYKLIL